MNIVFQIQSLRIAISMLSIVLFMHFPGYAQQSVTIGGTQLSNDAVLWLVPNGQQGLLLPATSRSGFTPSRAGMVIFDTDRVYYWDGSSWIGVGGGAGANYTLRLETGSLILSEDGNDVSSVPLNLGGDLSGGLTNATVVALNGISLPAGAPSNDQILVFDSGSGTWQYEDLPTGTFTGVTTDNVTVLGDGDTTPLSVPTFSGQGTTGVVPDPGSESGRFLQDDGTWVTPSGGGDMNRSTYDINSDDVVDDSENTFAIQGTPVSATAPTANQVLQFSGGSWIPTTLPIATLQDLASVLAQGNDASGSVITGLGAPTLATDAATKGYVDGLIPIVGTLAIQDANSVNITGGTLSGVTVSGDGSGLTNVDASSIDGVGVDMSVAPTSGQVLKFDGTNWIPDADLQGSGGTLPTLADAQLITSSGADNPIAVTPSGDLGMDNAGNFNINPGVIDDADISGTANIDVAKLAGGVDGDVLTTFGGVPTWQPSAVAITDLSSLTDVGDVTTPALGNSLIYDGSEWIATQVDVTNGILPPGGADKGILVTDGTTVSWLTTANANRVFGTDLSNNLIARDVTLSTANGTGIRIAGTATDANLVSEAAVREALDAIGGGSLQAAYDGGSIIDLDGTNDFRINDTGGGSLIMTNEPAGFVSIGNTFPNAPLHVFNSTTSFVRIENSTAYWDLEAGTDLVFNSNVRPNAYIMGLNGFQITASDIIIANPSRGDGGRAFVHNGTGSGTDDQLVMNFNGDFENGIELAGPLVNVAGNLGVQAVPTVGLAIGTSDAVQLPVGTVAERPAPFNGMIRFNSELTTFEGYDGATWVDFLGGASSLQGAYDGGNTVVLDGTNNIQIDNNAGDRNILYLDESGNVGIGNTNPLQLLDIKGNDPDDPSIISLSNSDESHQLLLFPGRTGDPNPFVLWKEGDPMRFATEVSSVFTERMIIQSDGSIGMGTTVTPTYLTVNGEVAIQGDNSTGGALTFPSTIDLTIDDSDTGFDVDTDGELALVTNDQEWVRYRVGSTRFGLDDISDRVEINSGDIYMLNDNNDVLLTMEGNGVGQAWTLGVEDTQDADFIISKSADLASPVLFLQNSGTRVAINKVDPLVTLDIFGTDAIQLPVGLDAERPVSSQEGMIRYNSEQSIFEGYNGIAWNNLAGAGLWSPSGGDILYTSGNVGIGVGAFVPSDIFHIQGSDAAVASSGVFLKIHNDVPGTGGVSSGILFDTYVTDNAGAKGGVFFRRNGSFGVGDLLFSINNQSGNNSNVDASDGFVRMIIRQSGRVGIGTTIPRATLDVTGTDAISIPSGTDAQRPGTPNAGMIRFNTTSSIFEGFDGTDWAEVGTSLIGFTGNIFYAGPFTGTTGTGSQNTFVGRSAGANTTTGGFNTFLGSSSGLFTTTGQSNIFIGGETGQSNTTGSDNTYVGYAAGRNTNSNGNEITLIGSSTSVTTNNLTNATGIGANTFVSQDNTVILGNGADVGVGTSTPARQMEVFSTSSTFLRVSGTGAAFASGGLELNGTGTLDWRIQPSLGILVFQQGDVDGAMSNQFLMNNNVFTPGDDATKTLGQSGSRWTTVFATNGVINTSDRREKKDINELAYGLEEIMRLNPVTYRWKRDDIDQNEIHIGLIAQDVRKVVPEVVDEGEDGRLGLTYSELVPVLIKATQELTNKVEALEKENKELKDSQERLTKLEKELEEIRNLLNSQASNKVAEKSN